MIFSPTLFIIQPFKPWMNYILEQNITKIILTNYALEDTNDKTITLTKDELKNIFTKLMNYKLKLEYIGGTGWNFGIELNVKYQKNGKEYNLYIDPNSALIIEDANGNFDSNLKSVINDSVDIKDEEGKNLAEMYPYYYMINSRGVLEDYFK